MDSSQAVLTRSLSQPPQARVNETIAVVGLGYVGLPVALSFSRAGFRVIGYDVSERRIMALRNGHDWTGEADATALLESDLHLAMDASEMADASFFIITVPTPIDGERRPDLGAVIGACEAVGRVIRPGSVVVLESTVYPGVTEEICGPALSRVSGLVQGIDFKMGYSPERINPGDREHTIDRVVKVVSAEDSDALERVAAAYAAIVPAGVHCAPCIRVAEAAKVIENTQRDLNIALMNELAIIFHRLGIRTRDVLEAAGTKWNFLNFSPGLVGGHCIGVDPYYLTAKAVELGYNPQLILAARRLNDSMGNIIARRVVRFMAAGNRPIQKCKVGILGLTFKENVPDIRNSRVPDVLVELRTFGIEPVIHDPLADPKQVLREYGITISSLIKFKNLDALILAVPHAQYRKKSMNLPGMLRKGGIFADIKSVVDRKLLPSDVRYWSL